MVSGIWLQTGSDIKKLEAGLRFLKEMTKAMPVTIYGSFFLPTKKYAFCSLGVYFPYGML